MDKEKNNSLISGGLQKIDSSNQQVIMMGSILVGLNLLLMVSVGLYWTHPGFHQYLSGSHL